MAERVERRQRTDAAASVAPADGVARIIDDGEAVTGGNLPQRGVIARLPRVIDGDNGARISDRQTSRISFANAESSGQARDNTTAPIA